MRLTGRLSRLSTRITLGAMVVVIGGGMALLYLIGQGRQEATRAHQQSAVYGALRHNAEQLKHVVGTLRQDVLFLASTPPVSGIVRATSNQGFDPRENSSREKWERRLQEIFAAFSIAHPDYFQICFIGTADGGREIVRIDNRGGQVRAVAAGDLQRKGERNYFKAVLRLKRGEVFLSEFDLDQERDKAEETHRPTLRAATPVFSSSGDLFGVIVVNMAATGLLESLRNALPAGTHAYVANMNGDYLLHPEAERNFGFRRGREERIVQEFPVLQTMFNSAAPDTMALQRSDTAGGDHDLAAGRIRFDPAQPGRFLLLAYDMPKEGMSEQLYAALDRKTVIGGLIAILLASGVVWFALRRIFAPLSQLTSAAAKVAQGDMSAQLPPVESGEVGDLVHAIRGMLESIDEREKDLRIAASTFETQEAIMIMDIRPRILRVNKAFTTITGYAEAEVQWMSPRMLIPDRLDSAFYDEMWETLLLAGRWSGKLWSRRKNGETFPRWQTVTAVLNDKGEVTHYVSIFSDISEQVRAESEIRQMAGEMKRQNEVLQLYKSKIEEEREIARNLLQQLSALDAINDPAVRFHMRMMDEFSGDMVAAARTPDGRLHVLLADGTGHGMNAALSVSPLAQLFYQMTRKGFDITSIASEMNQRVRSYLPLPRYVAAVLVSIETSMLPLQHRRTIRVWNGGCPPATLFRIEDGGIHHFRSRHLPMGIVGRDAFDSSVEYFESADENMQLLLCSDGLTELALDSGMQLGDSGLLYRQDAPGERFDSLLKLVDDALTNKSPADDISLMLVDLTRQQDEEGSEPSLSDTVDSFLDNLQDKDDWSFSLTLTSAQLKRLDTVPLLLNVASQFEEARLDGKLFVVLAELFNNALDHGLLKLDSGLKNETNGMEMYFEERASRLARLEKGSIEIHLEKLLYGQNGGIRIRIRDSGGGFDHARLGLQDLHAKHGRGITLLRSLCSRLEYQGDGSEVIALLPLH